MSIYPERITLLANPRRGLELSASADVNTAAV